MNKNQTLLYTYIVSVVKDDSLRPHISEIVTTFKKSSLKKNELFVEKGKVCSHFCYIQSGILQHSLLISGEEKTTYLALKNSCTTALHSFKNKVASRKSIKAISDCDLWILDAVSFEKLIKENPAFYAFYYTLIEQQIFKIDNYRIDLLLLSPEERYQKLLQNEPILLQQIPLHYLSSFLGISTRHMSRIRKNIK